MSAKVVKLGDTAKLYGALMRRLRALGCVFCPLCHAYLYPDHLHVETVELREAA